MEIPGRRHTDTLVTLIAFASFPDFFLEPAEIFRHQ
jgi:hypothetical protein